MPVIAPEAPRRLTLRTGQADRQGPGGWRTAAFGAVLLALAAALPVSAKLQWEAKQHTVTLHATDKVAAVRFAFINAGTEPVTITEVRPSCGCTVPQLAKNTYAPGERGELEVSFHPGNREGTVSMPLILRTDDAGESATLTLVAHIETIVAFDTRFVFWKGEEPRTPKAIRLTFAKDLIAELTGVESSSHHFATTFHPVGTTGREYEITVTPPADVLTYTAISVHTLIGAEKTERTFTVVARTMDVTAAERARANPAGLETKP